MVAYPKVRLGVGSGKRRPLAAWTWSPQAAVNRNRTGMNAIFRAAVVSIAPVLILAPPFSASTWAVECRIGPVAVEAPICGIKQEPNYFEGPAQYVEWEEDGYALTAIAVTPAHRREFRGYPARWFHNHKCAGKEIVFGHEVHVAGPDGAGNGTPPQKTWTGTCAAPVSYIVRAIRLKRYVIELHADTGCCKGSEPNRGHGKRTGLEPALAALLAKVRLLPGN
jgi:hypothetical protein